MTIALTEEQIRDALPLVERGLSKYVWIQTEVALGTTRVRERDFQKKFNGFYRIRRNQEWQAIYYGLFSSKLLTGIEFREALDFMVERTGRFEASFISKLVATIHPSKYVIDSMVLTNVGLALPVANAPDRIKRICRIYEMLDETCNTFLGTELGRFLVKHFRKTYPWANITEAKMLDLVLWQIRQR